MEDRIVNLVLILFLVGALFLAKGMTGLSIGSFCCFPPNCPVDKICNMTVDSIWQNTISFYIGILTIISSVLLYVVSTLDKRK